ncbi:GrpE-domain-containing protein [Cristinia sonorae]|uniref:GrpE protein homolog, mitochondrial n=1 Tax=Cristinia sonorae TaxID=1940300 RepID=A0A8K0UZG5_9AGAR|nr:GrpE-domain-containing protein [Cristinia sonorae]
MSAFQLYKSCASSFSARSLARSSVATSSRLRVAAPAARRHYSETKSEPATESKQEATPDSSSTPEAECLAKLKKKEEEVTDLTSRLRYLQADFLNLQRNAAREKEQTKDFAITRFAGDLLETVDVLALALKSVPQSVLPQPPDASSSSSSTPSSPSEKTPEAYLGELYTGVEMTHRLLVQTLFKYNVKPFDPTGDVFDPNRHEALYQAPIPGKEPGTVLECQKIGYTIKDRVLRAAQVGVVQDTSS